LCVCRKYIEIEIFDDEDYEKKESFFIELDRPISELAKGEEDVNEAGKPKIGEVGRLEVQIRESKEIKVGFLCYSFPFFCWSSFESVDFIWLILMLGYCW